MSTPLNVGDHVEIHLDTAIWESRGWFPGRISRIDPYSAHRRFFWVELEQEVRMVDGAATRLVSVFNPTKIRQR